MQLPRRRHPAFDETRVFEYPAHLRAALDDLPAAPGVYVFHSQTGDAPLYIGKSVNLRARVLSHLRNPDEDRMLRQTARISHVRTAGEVGALLLEARMVKQLSPLLNQRLRVNRQLCAVRLEPDGRTDVVYARDVDFAVGRGLFGLYGSRHAALDALNALADQHRLCLGLMGLERLTGSRGCFRAMVKRCAGACCGLESHTAHRDRLLSALQELRQVSWPFPGAVALVERFDGAALGLPDMTQWHVVRHWHYVGSTQSLQEARDMDSADCAFDADGYRILSPLLGAVAAGVPRAELVHLPDVQA